MGFCHVDLTLNSPNEYSPNLKLIKSSVERSFPVLLCINKLCRYSGQVQYYGANLKCFSANIGSVTFYFHHPAYKTNLFLLACFNISLRQLHPALS